MVVLAHRRGLPHITPTTRSTPRSHPGRRETSVPARSGVVTHVKAECSADYAVRGGADDRKWPKSGGQQLKSSSNSVASKM